MSCRVIFRDDIEFPLTKMERRKPPNTPRDGVRCKPHWQRSPAMLRWQKKGGMHALEGNTDCDWRRSGWARARQRLRLGGRISRPPGEDYRAVRACGPDRCHGAADRA